MKSGKRTWFVCSSRTHGGLRLSRVFQVTGYHYLVQLAGIQSTLNYDMTYYVVRIQYEKHKVYP
jgi:hypothetical protein